MSLWKANFSEFRRITGDPIDTIVDFRTEHKR